MVTSNTIEHGRVEGCVFTDQNDHSNYFVNFALWHRKQGKEDEHIIRTYNDSFIHSFIHSLNKYLLQAYPEPGTNLDIGGEGGRERMSLYQQIYI